VITHQSEHARDSARLGARKRGDQIGKMSDRESSTSIGVAAQGRM
jgi:hypothetical protein